MKTESGGELEQSTMHQAVSSSVPAFLAKLWAMVNEENTDSVIGWTEVNGFRKVLSPMAGSLRNESDEMIFAHPDFVKDEPWGLENIKRKLVRKEVARETAALRREVGRETEALRQEVGRETEALRQEVARQRERAEQLERRLAELSAAAEAHGGQHTTLRPMAGGSRAGSASEAVPACSVAGLAQRPAAGDQAAPACVPAAAPRLTVPPLVWGPPASLPAHLPASVPAHLPTHLAALLPIRLSAPLPTPLPAPALLPTSPPVPGPPPPFEGVTVKSEPVDPDETIPHHKDLPAASGELIARLYSEVKSMKSKQDSLDSHLSKMKRENESLWREVLVLRQKHAKQQQIVNKVIQFLVPFLQTGRGTSSFMGLKRKQLPMLEDSGGGPAGGPSAKAPRLTRTYSMDENMAASIDNRSIASSAGSPGPVIHEVTDVTSPVASNGAGASTTQSQALASFSASPG
ncbi:Heat shock factor protein 1 [Amphibalanus amphitrite]|uniref:Heat shock factor protein 1 n=1 Tax=Amphibalanus amphitrite TaxID=1232801 RepID=A0A6A4WGW1_AMPAM|nr:Heat shock factor protein 1 [Amphibalanus amphitrite]